MFGQDSRISNKRSASEILGDSPPIDKHKLFKKPNTLSVLKIPHAKGKSTKDTSERTFNFNVLIENQFSLLNNDETTNSNLVNITADSLKNTKLKIPHYYVGATNFTKAIAIARNISGDKYTSKYMSVGVKIQLSNI